MASRMLPGGLDIKHSPSSNIISIISAVIMGLLSKLQYSKNLKKDQGQLSRYTEGQIPLI